MYRYYNYFYTYRMYTSYDNMNKWIWEASLQLHTILSVFSTMYVLNVYFNKMVKNPTRVIINYQDVYNTIISHATRAFIMSIFKTYIQWRALSIIYITYYGI